MHLLTFVTPKPQKDFDMGVKQSHPEIVIEDRTILDDRAVQWTIPETLDKTTIESIRTTFKIDVFQTTNAPIKLFMADMDSTIVKGETLDDMAAMVGIGDKIAAITTRAMRGELDFENALTERIALLKGMSSDIIDQALEAIEINPGATDLLNHLKSQNIYCVLISGGFTQFTSVAAEQLGFDDHFGNELILSSSPHGGGGDKLFLSGDVKRPILDKNFKLQKLQDLQNTMNLTPENIMTIGDGANDLPMLTAAGAGISYFGKPLLKETLTNQINYTDLSSLIYLIK